jgi:peptidoglycan/LPS O-acetylase OafA/YrhL
VSDSVSVAEGRPADQAAGRIAGLDMVRGLAILWVVVFHLWVDVKLVALPPADYYHTVWHRISGGQWDRAGTSVVDAVSRIGFQGVPVFMMLSGLSLYLSASRRGSAAPLLPWYYARLRRLLVPYWAGFFVLLGGACVVAALQVWLDGHSFAYQYHHGVTVAAYHVIDIGWDDALVSLALVPRVLRDRWFGVYPDSLWFVVVLAQYYLLFPFLRALIDRAGPGWFAGGALLVTVVAKGLLIATFGGLLQGSAFRYDGGVALFRIYDFALGIALGYMLVHRRHVLVEYTATAFDVAGIIFIGLLLQIGGTLIDDRQAYFNAIAVPMSVTGLTLLALPLIVKRPGRIEANPPARILAWTGTISYAVLIVNEPMRLFASLLRVHDVPASAWWVFLVAVYVPVTVLVAWPFAVLTGLVPRPRRGAARLRIAADPAASSNLAG